MSNTQSNEATKWKHRNCIIELTPSETIPEMVTITKTPKLRSGFEGRRYINLEKAWEQIELYESMRLIKSKDEYIKGQLEDVVILDFQ
tara:strand:+ start:684 stop:947 length:264 start_codon:yes stop_codon:yes gene_type:complete